MPVSLVTN